MRAVPEAVFQFYHTSIHMNGNWLLCGFQRLHKERKHTTDLPLTLSVGTCSDGVVRRQRRERGGQRWALVGLSDLSHRICFMVKAVSGEMYETIHPSFSARALSEAASRSSPHYHTARSGLVSPAFTLLHTRRGKSEKTVKSTAVCETCLFDYIYIHNSPVLLTCGV